MTKPSFISLQSEWCEHINRTSGMIPLWQVVNDVLMDLYDDDTLRGMQQGLQDKQYKIYRQLQKTGIPMVDVDNAFINEDHKWAKDFFTIVDKKDVAELTQLTRDIETGKVTLV